MNRGKILIIDDDRFVLKALRSELEMDGYTVVTVLSGSDAIEKVSNEQFDIVYIDLVTPEMNCVSICREIKLRSPSTEVILFSGNPVAMKEIEAEFIATGGRSEFLVKPLIEDALTSITNKVMQEKRSQEK